jgi:A/G-specific adenine glycosylase
MYHNQFALSKRKEGLLKNMYEFPNIEGFHDIQELEKKDYQFEKEFSSYKHIFTHVIWNMKVYLFQVNQKDSNYIWASFDEIKQKYAVPTAFKSVLLDLEEFLNENK